MLVYPHVEYGRVVYLSARSIVGKQHYQPPVDLVGKRRLYFNWLYSAMMEHVVAVEGQADAITLGQWGIPAVAVAGNFSPELLELLVKVLRKHQVVYIGFDQDEAGQVQAQKLAERLGPLTRMVKWPAKDANDWLQEGNPTSEEVVELLAAAPTWAEAIAAEVATVGNGERPEALRYAFRVIAQLDDFDLATYRKDLADAMQLGLREFDGMLKATAAEVQRGETAEEAPLLTRAIIGGQVQVDGSEDPNDYYLVETLYEPPRGAAGSEAHSTGKTQFVVRLPSGELEIRPHLDTKWCRYLPPPPGAQLLRKRVVSFAAEVGPLLSTRQLIEEVQATIHKYVELSPFFERMSAYYVLLSWFYDAFNIVPYVRFRGDYGTGKSRARKIVGGLCFRPMRASGAASDASLFRMIDTWRGSLLLEEADYQQTDYGQLVIKLLNQGYDREQGIILRCADRAKDFETEAYVCFGPKILAMRGVFQDEALESRCLTEDMQQKTREDIPRELPQELWEVEIPRLQGMLLRYRMEHWRPHIAVNEGDVDIPIEDRLIQIVLALFAIIDDAELKAELREYLMQYHRATVERRGLTLASKVLEALIIKNQIQADEGLGQTERDLSVQTITELVNQLMDFENYGEENYNEQRARRKGGNETGSRKVGYVLRTQLQLDAERSSKFSGRHVVQWNESRVKSLRKRYGIDDGRLVDLLRVYQEIQRLEAEGGEEKEIRY